VPAGPPIEEVEMLRREITVPVSIERLWHVMTDATEASRWFGAQIRWELVPGGQAWFEDADGARAGHVEHVEPGRELRFRWWSANDGEDDSVVTYRLDPAEGGTRLTVTEEPSRSDEGAVRSRASSSTSRRGRSEARAHHAPAGGAWTTWDGRLAGAWCVAHAPALLVS
jgi:uncharacterized protein YndB with AHSA1/START domain